MFSTALDVVMGGVMFYSIIHFFIIQNERTWKERTKYERLVSIVAIICILLLITSIISS